MLSHHWQNIMHHVLGSQCGLCTLPLNTSQPPNPLRWCSHCFQSLSPVKRCQQCGLAMQEIEIDDSVCGECLTEPPPWQRLFTLGDYDFPLSHEVQRFKDHGESWHVDSLTQLLATRIAAPAPLITSVPLHWRRYLSRGFNQSDVLARHLATHLHSHFEPKLFRRTKYADSQRGQTKSHRERNLQGIFVLNKKPKCKHVAIVDDVVTTGSTVRQLCQLLLEVGVESIDIYCICRTPAPTSL
ncbi:phosphoribosyltransferase family protein [uncultured Vibrio sp.]|uniref:ComF family protein n=1 Tax=uncultured Vibrio sp. TaxID=114054 RepID=UPI0029C86B27|nr:phosphoribosyltransferase family protein [uncultured Vibrio sp.]